MSEGWLTSRDQNEILLRFHGNPFKFYKKRYAERSYCIKVTPFDLRHKEVSGCFTEYIYRCQSVNLSL